MIDVVALLAVVTIAAVALRLSRTPRRRPPSRHDHDKWRPLP